MLIHGDCLEVLPTLPPASVQMVFADLPYAVTKNAWDILIPIEPLWASLIRLCHGTSILTATQPFATMLINAQPSLFRYDLIWHKKRASGFLNTTNRPLRQHEHLLVFASSVSTYNAQKTSGGKTYCVTTHKHQGKTYAINKEQSARVKGSVRHPQSVLTFDESDLRRDTLNGHRPKLVHPTQKPVALLEWLIRTYTNEGDTVLDPVAGSGTTAIAAINTGRKWVCIEKDKGYYDIAAKRIADHLAAPKQATLNI